MSESGSFSSELSSPEEENSASSSADSSLESESEAPTSSEASSSEESSGPRSVEIYAINDFHGQIKEEGSYPGIDVVGSYLKRRGQEENTLLVSSGDMFQGTFESNYNYGGLLSEVMNECEFDAFSLGNHDFDWGLEALRENKDRVSPSGYQTPYLCANLYDYGNGEDGDAQQSEYGGEYAVSELENGLRIGIIGAIGEAQIASISSSKVSNVCFKDPVPIVKRLSDKLRLEESCDLVILSFHAGQSAILNTGVTSLSPNSGKRYVDLVLCAHTHRYESTTENGVIFTQNNDKGEDVSHVTLTVNQNGEVSSSLSTVYASSMKQEANRLGYDGGIEDLVSSCLEETEKAGNRIIGSLEGDFSSREELPNMMATAILEEASESYDGVDIAMVNNARESLSSGSLTYSDLLTAFPFDNEVCVIKTSGATLLKEAGYNYFARASEEAFEENGTYTVAVIDYLALHQNSSRVYDYFPDAEILGTLRSDSGGMRFYYSIVADYLTSEGTVYSSAYSSSLAKHNKSSLTYSVSL